MAKKATVKKAAPKRAKKKVAKRAVKKTPVKKAAAPRVKKTVAKKAPEEKPPAKKAGKNPLTAAERREFRKILLEKRSDLVGDMSGAEAETLHITRQEGAGDLSNLPTHPADIGTDNYEQEFTLGLLESERVLLTEIDEALARLEAGTYGVCLGTGEPIGKARLRARPWAKYGIEYARLVERGLVSPNDKDAESDEDA